MNTSTATFYPNLLYRDADADIPLKPANSDYGSRDFTARDPEGNLWAFGTYRPKAGTR